MKKTPKLRFKEFSGDWEVKKLRDLGEFRKTYSFSRNIEGEGNFKHIHYGDIHMNYNGIISKEKLIPNIDIPNDENYELIKERDIIFADASEDRKDLGKVAVVRSIEGNILSGLHTLCFRPNETLNSEFFLNHSLNKEYLKFMYTRGNGAKVLGISKSSLSEYKFLAPSKEEQEKIASFFYLIDDKISLQREKVEALKDYKSGIIQKIFNKELRFKDGEGRDYPEWEMKKLKSILKEVSEKTKENNQHDVISSTTNGLFLQKEYFNREIASSDNIGYKIIRKNQVVLSPQNLWMGNINFNEKYDIGIVSPSYKVFDINDKFDSKYIGYILRTQRAFYEFMQSSEQGASIVRRNLNMDLFNEISFDIPCKEEQIKISKFIGSIDFKLEKEQEKLDYLNEYKKGLLQQMFV